MAENQQSTAGGSPLRERQKTAAPSKLDQNIAQLQQMKLGGFKLLETAIEGVDNLNPERRAKKRIFLEEADRSTNRSTNCTSKT